MYLKRIAVAASASLLGITAAMAQESTPTIEEMWQIIQQQQAQIDAQRATALERQYEPYQRIGFMSDIFRGVPTQTQTLTSTTAPKPSMLSQIGGIGMGIAGLQQAGAFGEGGLFGSIFGS